MARISRRVGAISESATMAVTARAKAMIAKGMPVIGFGAGEPDFPTPDHIVEAAQRAAADPRLHHYTPAAGLPELRAAVAAKTLRDSGVEVNPDQVLITNGAKQAVYSSLATLLDPGDEVLLPAPYWVTYPEAIRLFEAVPVTVPTGPDTGYKVRVEDLERAVTERCKVLMFVSPSNPTGAVYTPDEVKAIGEWAMDRGLWVVTDEIYEHLVYGDAVFSSMASEVPDLNVVIVNGVAKAYAMTGWRVGWAIGPGDLITAASNLQSHLSSNVANVSQMAALAALSGPQESVTEMRRAFDRRRRRMVKMLTSISDFVCPEPMGAFYAFPSISGLFGRNLNGVVVDSALDLARVALDQALVAFVPGEAFGAPGYARFSYALSDEELEEGLGRISELLS